MTLQRRIKLLVKLGEFIKLNSAEWISAKEKAYSLNAWFTADFIDLAANNIATQFLNSDLLEAWAEAYGIPNNNNHVKTIGLVMAGNIPMVGFHDMLCIFISGHQQHIKLSGSDNVLIPFLVSKMIEWEEATATFITFADKLNNCEAYITTGSNNSSRYFEYYFGKYPHIIRRNRTSVAVLNGNETGEQLESLADDIHQYYGLGCRNVTKLYVPTDYNFEPLLIALKKYDHFSDFHKYRNNYDYQLALVMMSNTPYMTNDSVVLAEKSSPFTAVSCINYEVYTDKMVLTQSLKTNEDLQCIAGIDVPFGQTQKPTLTSYADGIDTLEFLLNL